MYFSPKTMGFYSRDVHGDAIPEDALEITSERHVALMDEQSRGARIVAGADGQPTAVFPAAPTLDDLRAQARAKVLAWAADFGRRFTAGYTQEEVAGWPVKAAAARAHLAGEPQSIIAAEAALTGEDPDALAALIVGLADAYEDIVARITGLRRATYDAIRAAQTPEAISEAVITALQTAQSIINELGLTE